jgi:hypothetical protein
MTTADVPALVEKTRNKMLVALRTISQPAITDDHDAATEPLLSASQPTYASVVASAADDAEAGDSAEPKQTNGARASSNGMHAKGTKRAGTGKLAIA